MSPDQSFDVSAFERDQWNTDRPTKFGSAWLVQRRLPGKPMIGLLSGSDASL